MGALQQLWLDLWKGGAPAPAKKPIKRPVTPVNKALIAIESEAIGDDLLPRHPAANRALALAQGRVAYQLVRARRKSIGFTVGLDGLVVRAPGWVGADALDAALQHKADWIVRQLARMHERARQADAARIAWQDGAALPWLGQALTLRLGAARTQLAEGGVRPELQLALPASAPPERVQAAVQRWWMEAARTHLAARLAHYAPLLGVAYTRWQLSGARTRWGSASASGAIRLNWRLLHYPPAVIDYVVVHELAHLRVMDHSPRFWAEVARICPDYLQLRRALRELPAPAWD